MCGKDETEEDADLVDFSCSEMNEKVEQGEQET